MRLELQRTLTITNGEGHLWRNMIAINFVSVGKILATRIAEVQTSDLLEILVNA
jgi:hypothetical protein